MRKFVLFLAMTILLSGCGAAQKYQLARSAWATVTNAEADGVTGAVVSTFYFISDTEVMMMTSVKNGTKTLVTPFLSAQGTYKVDGNPKVEADFILYMVDAYKNPFECFGKYSKDSGMVIKFPDNSTKIFSKINKVTIK